MVYIDPKTPYMTLFADFLAKKHRLAIDAWGADDSAVKGVYEPLVKHVLEEVDTKYQNLYPFPVWKVEDRVKRLARSILLAEYLVQEWADHFIGKSEAEIDEIAKSFRYENCLKREGLNHILTENAKAMA